MRQWVEAEAIGPRWQLRDGLRVLAEAWQWREAFYWKRGLTGEPVRCESLEQAKREAEIATERE